MRDEDGKEMSEKDLIKESMYMLADAGCLLYETESGEAKALAFMVDYALKYAQVIHRGDDVLLAAADYTRYEENVFAQSKIKAKTKKQIMKVIK